MVTGVCWSLTDVVARISRGKLRRDFEVFYGAASRWVRVVSLGVSISGPLGLRHLADFGAEVIKVEPPGGDMVRHWDSAVSGEDHHFWVNPNKRSVVLNLKDERGRAVLRRLIAGADVFLENTVPGRPSAWASATRRCGVSARTSSISMPSGYGQNGPYRDMKAFDGLIQAETG